MHTLTKVRGVWGATALLAGLLLLAFSLAPIALREFRRHFTPAFLVDCATLPPRQAFEEVFCRSVPAGVTDIQGAGIPQSGQVWMRLRATGAAIRILVGGGKPDAPKAARSTIASLSTWPESRRVHWEGALDIHQPECYHLGIGSNPTVDYITMVVDRQRHLVYVYRHFI
jgi:hypothetical protein